MAFEVPFDLINQSQIGFREDAGLSSFDPEDPTVPSLQTVEESISALDPLPPRLRCKHCKGKLLRGSQSLICIYCGQCQAKDLPPEPIFFNSTTGYRWLLQSLDLNDSERIGPLVEENKRNKGRSPAEDGKTLSELLDLQIAWRDEPETPETGFVNKTFDHSSSSLNLSKVVLDNFFTGSQRDIDPDASEEQPVTSKNDQSYAFVDHENLSLFQKVPPPDTAAISSDLSGHASSGHDAEIQSVNSRTQNEDPNTAAVSSDLSCESSSGCDAGIQSVNSRMQNEDSKSVDHFVGSEADLSAHMDSVSGYMEDLNSNKMNKHLDHLPSPGDDRIQVDPIHKD